MRRVAIWLLAVAVTVALAVVAVRWWAVAHLDFSNVGRTTEVRPSDVAAQVEALAQDVKEGKVPWTKVDLTSIGAPGAEAQLLELRRLLQVFEVGFKRPPKDASELRLLITQGHLSSHQRRLVEEDAGRCNIFVFPEYSYLLNCDGWHPAGEEVPKSLVERFDVETERFYLVHGHVFLYAPPSVAHR